MIKTLRLINFRSHADSTLRMEPITLLVGPAGAGKSNVFKAMVALQNSVHRTLVEMFPPGLGEFHWVRSRWADETDPIGFQVQIDQLPEFPDFTAEYGLKIADSPAGLYVLEETLTKQFKQQRAEWVFRAPPESNWDGRIWHRRMGDANDPSSRVAR